jgi:hypothetical protein
MKKLSLIAVLAAALVASVFVASGVAAKPPVYSPSLTVSWPFGPGSATASWGTSYVITGCGYNAGYGDVTVVVYSPVSAGWTGATPDANGCISVSNFSTQGAGTYQVQAWQQVRKKSVEVASTSFTIS